MKRRNNGMLIGLTLLAFCPFIGFAQASLQESIDKGRDIYNNECSACHMENGQGIEGAFPPLANSDYFNNDLAKAVNAIINGLEGELVVNGNTYFGVMEPVPLSDEEIADVLNYVQNSWGGSAEMVTEEEVKRVIMNSEK